jgi:hypothetical protein
MWPSRGAQLVEVCTDRWESWPLLVEYEQPGIWAATVECYDVMACGSGPTPDDAMRAADVQAERIAPGVLRTLAPWLTVTGGAE